MKYNLGSSPTIAPMTGESRQWFPSITIKKKTDVGLKVGQKFEGEVEGIVTGIRVDPETKQICCEVELHYVETSPPSAMQRAGY